MTPAASAGEVVWEADYRDWIALLKPRVLTLVVFTGVIGLLVAPGHLHPVLAFTAILCITVAAGACGAINMWYDRDIDAIMRRTRKRPIPAGRIEPGAALGFGITLAVGSVHRDGAGGEHPGGADPGAVDLLLRVHLHDLAEAPDAAEHRHRRRRRSLPARHRLGGGHRIGRSGAAGPVRIVFIWTPPHFWSLALWANDDYRRAGVPMLPVVAGARETRRQIMLYTLVLVPLTLAPFFMGFSGRAISAWPPPCLAWCFCCASIG